MMGPHHDHSQPPQTINVKVVDHTAGFLKRFTGGFQEEEHSLHPWLLVPQKPRDKARHFALWLTIPGMSVAIIRFTKPLWYAVSGYLALAIALPLFCALGWTWWLSAKESKDFAPVAFHWGLGLASCVSVLISIALI